MARNVDGKECRWQGMQMARNADGYEVERDTKQNASALPNKTAS